MLIKVVDYASISCFTKIGLISFGSCPRNMCLVKLKHIWEMQTVLFITNHQG